MGDVGGRTDPEALAAFGLPDDFQTPADPGLEIWPENESAVQLFVAMGTQWAAPGMTGRPTGMRYEALPAVMRYCSIPAAEQPGAFAALRIMERAAMEAINGK